MGDQQLTMLPGLFPGLQGFRPDMTTSLPSGRSPITYLTNIPGSRTEAERYKITSEGGASKTQESVNVNYVLHRWDNHDDAREIFKGQPLFVLRLKGNPIVMNIRQVNRFLAEGYNTALALWRDRTTIVNDGILTAGPSAATPATPPTTSTSSRSLWRSTAPSSTWRTAGPTRPTTATRSASSTVVSSTRWPRPTLTLPSILAPGPTAPSPPPRRRPTRTSPDISRTARSSRSAPSMSTSSRTPSSRTSWKNQSACGRPSTPVSSCRESRDACASPCTPETNSPSPGTTKKTFFSQVLFFVFSQVHKKTQTPFYNNGER